MLITHPKNITLEKREIKRSEKELKRKSVLVTKKINVIFTISHAQQHKSIDLHCHHI